MNKLLLSGYKTWVGLAMIGVGSVLEAIGIAGSHQIIMWGGILAGVGGGHKILKESGALSDS